MQRDQYEKETLPQDASALTVGIIVSEFNSDITEGMLAGARETFAAWKVKDENITVRHVPGAFELPLGCAQLLKEKKYDLLIALGCVIKGETKHDEYISHAVSQAIMRLQLETLVPIGFGVITPNTLEQAQARSAGKANKGSEAAIAALRMALEA